MGERNSANAQTRVELKTARWRPRREIDEFAGRPFHIVVWGRRLQTHRVGPGTRPYHGVKLYRDGIKLDQRIAILVANAFVPNSDPATFIEVSHNDGNKTNDRADNLTWTTHADNMNLAKDSSSNGTLPLSESPTTPPTRQRHRHARRGCGAGHGGISNPGGP